MVLSVGYEPEWTEFRCSTNSEYMSRLGDEHSGEASTILKAKLALAGRALDGFGGCRLVRISICSDLPVPPRAAQP